MPLLLFYEGFMEFNDFIAEINNLKYTLPRNEIIQSVLSIEKKAYDYLKIENFKKWRSGKGLLISGQLSSLKDAIIKKVIEAIGGVPKEITVIAVGGYGRSELSPYSDVDILLLYSDGIKIEEFAKIFLYYLWDMNYHLGSSTRTLSNVMEQGMTDETFLTSIFEARFLAGDYELFQKLNPTIAKILKRTRKDYLKSKVEEIRRIFLNPESQPSNEVLLKEPNLKNNSGGLRSVHLMEWLNFALYNQRGLEGLKESLPKIYFRKLSIAYDFILYIRNMLHFINQRKEDNLYLDYHSDVANYLELEGDEYSKIRRLMKHYYEKASDIQLILLYMMEEINIKFFKEKKKEILFYDKNKLTDYFIINNQFYINKEIKPSIEKALEFISLYTQNKNFYSFSLIQYLKESSFLITDKERSSREIFNQFKNILNLGNSYEALTVLKLSGFIYRYIPLFGKIKHMILHNPFHKYTVDQHSIEAVRALESLYTKEIKESERLKYVILQETAINYRDNIWVVKFCLILHDIGKTYNGDHAKNGVEMADEIFKKIPIYTSYKKAILFLINNHLLLSNIIRRSDISSMQLLLDLAKEFFMTAFPVEYLDFLFLLTYSDIYATNPKNFSGYMAELLNRVYRNVSGLLSRKIDENYQADLIKSTAVRLIEKLNDDRINTFLSEISGKYILTNDEEDILSDYKTIREISNINYKIEIKAFNDYFKVKFFAADKIGLFSLLSGILFLNGADVVRADIHTFENTALDEFYIIRLFGLDFTEHSMKEELRIWKENLDKLFMEYKDDYNKLSKVIYEFKKKLKPVNSIFHRKTEIIIDGTTGNFYKFDISCTDRPALLYDITSFLAQNNIEISNAIIDTAGWYVKDVFEAVINQTLNTGDTDELKNRLKTVIEQG